MASSPSYDPNMIESPTASRRSSTHADACPGSSSPLLNRATQGLYAPGSTFKAITAAAALDYGIYTPKSSFYDPGTAPSTARRSTNALDQNGPEQFGNVDLVQAYVHSINAVFCKHRMKLGAKHILDEAKKFGFYSKPPIETPAERGRPRAASTTSRRARCTTRRASSTRAAWRSGRSTCS